MKRLTTTAKHLCILGAFAALALSATPALAGGCLDQGENTFQTCIEIAADANGGVVTAAQEATCTQFAATITNACVRHTKPDPNYVVCTQSYTIIIIPHDPGPNDIVAAFYGPFNCS